MSGKRELPHDSAETGANGGKPLTKERLTRTFDTAGLNSL